MTRLLIVPLLALLLVGCGSDGGEEDPLAALDAASRKTKAAESNRQEFKMVFEGGGEEVSMSGEGTISADSTRGRITMDVEGGDAAGSFEAILNDGIFYMKGEELPIPEGKEWIAMKNAPTSTMSPSEFVDFLLESGDVTNEGSEEIRGEETTHFSGPLDVRKIAEEGGPELIERLNAQPDVEEFDMTIDIWVGQDALPRRMEVEIEPPDGQEGRGKITADILEYNVDVDADPPPPSTVAGG